MQNRLSDRNNSAVPDEVKQNTQQYKNQSCDQHDKHRSELTYFIFQIHTLLQNIVTYVETKLFKIL